MVNFLVTGGAGFIGSNFILHLLNKYPNYNIINLDLLTYAGNLNNLKEIQSSENRYTFVHGDICDSKLVNDLFSKYQFEGVFHFAAESHVDNSIKDSSSFIQTNIVGTHILLEAAKKVWLNSDNKKNEHFLKARFLHVSTDEVYGTLGEIGLFTEETPYAPNSPYSASKASSDMLVRSYFHTFDLNVVTTNCSNNYGPKQHSEKLIPTIIRKALSLENIPIYGTGENVRDWLYVLDHCKGIDLAFHSGKSGETYNIGGRNELRNIDLSFKILAILDETTPRKDNKSYTELITFVTDRLGHDKRYAIDASKIENNLQWKAEENFDSGIKKTIEWYLKD
ncbi:MAG: dTDP-glucose 4,6-dehydratase [Bacteroidota bacterium]